MLRKCFVVAWSVGTLLTAAPVDVALPQTRQTQESSLDTLKDAVIAATGYDRGTVELSATKVQLVVTIANSKLNDRPARDRESEAAQIASTIARAISDRPEFNSIQAMHVDYIRREAGGGRITTIDGIDFRKDPRGEFRHHVS